MPKSIIEVLANIDEKLILSINNLVLNYAKNKEIINQKYLDTLASYFIKEYNLRKYLHTTILDTDNLIDEHDSASYSFILKSITIHFASFLKELNNISQLFTLSPNDMTYLIYTYFNKIVFHEIAHSYELLEIKKSNNFESKLLSKSFKYTTKLEYFTLNLPESIRKLSLSLTQEYIKYAKRVKLYYRYYPCVPEERLAEYFANDLTLTLTNKLATQVELSRLSLMYHYVLLKNLLEGYDISLTPTLFYLKKLATPLDLPSISSTPLHTRLVYGLEITYKEYTELKTLKKSLYKSLK